MKNKANTNEGKEEEIGCLFQMTLTIHIKVRLDTTRAQRLQDQARLLPKGIGERTTNKRSP